MATANQINEAAELVPALVKRVKELETAVDELREENAVMTRILDAMTKEEVEEEVTEPQVETPSLNEVLAKPTPPKSTRK